MSEARIEAALSALEALAERPITGLHHALPAAIEDQLAEQAEEIGRCVRELRAAVEDYIDAPEALDDYHPPSNADLRSVPEVVAYCGGGVAKSGDVQQFRAMGNRLSQPDGGLVVRLPNDDRGGVDRYELRVNASGDWKYVYFGNDPWGGA